ncbi:ribulose-phosphate 3-epimerase [Aureococcus anophagefferens]|nr:ribulose-phosphate 3-epimerase [Aureococcus anophagefferens]
MGYKLPPILLYLLAVAPATRALPSFFKRESKPRLAVAVDVGTESLRVAVFDEDGVVVGSATEAHETFYPAPGRAEQALWLKRHEPETWDNAAVVCECQDWLNFKLTGGWAAGGSNVATRWHCDGAVAVAEPPRAAGPFRPFGGRPSALLAKIGLADLEDKWPMRCVATAPPSAR